MTVFESIQLMKDEGSKLAEPVPVVGMPPMTFECSFSSEGVHPDELTAVAHEIPCDLAEFWKAARSAKLFEDKEYGQWGLEILDPARALEFSDKLRVERPREFVQGDLVIGRFLGDSDLLVIRCDASHDDFGSVLVALPLDARVDWYKAAHSLADFLGRYAKTGGEKFWVVRG